MARQLPSTIRSLEQGARAAAPGEFTLLVVGERTVASYGLPARGEVLIGRDESCAIALDHGKVSRQHAKVSTGEGVRVHDLGSTNGVRLRGHKLGDGASALVQPGEAFQIGPFTAILLQGQERSGAGLDARAALVVPDPTPEAVSPVLARIAASGVSVVVHGETGVGKDVLARTLHKLSRRSGAFVALNCAALGETLLESELFGYERGAFTGAVQAKPGMFEAAAGGTLFLDEVADMSASVQAKLLRALENRQVTRLGSVKPVEVDVRFVAASHRELRAAVAGGAFRQDLYYRLNGVTLTVPPLRERVGAIAALATGFLAESARRLGRGKLRLHADTLAVLHSHPFPGNVRELRAVIERAALLAEGDQLLPEHLVLDAMPGATPAPEGERARIVAVLAECAGNQTRAARQLGISRVTLSHKLDQYGIPRPRK
jgi:two-component system response regulator AtoC